MKKIYIGIRLFAAGIRQLCKTKFSELKKIWRQLTDMSRNIDSLMVEKLIDQPVPSERIVISFLRGSSEVERDKVYRFIESIERLGCVVDTEESHKSSANGNTYAIASLYINNVMEWEIMLGRRSGAQLEVSKIII